jgi:hypothetical protein
MQKLEACRHSHEHHTVVVLKHGDSLTFRRKLQSIENDPHLLQYNSCSCWDFDCSVGRLTDY